MPVRHVLSDWSVDNNTSVRRGPRVLDAVSVNHEAETAKCLRAAQGNQMQRYRPVLVVFRLRADQIGALWYGPQPGLVLLRRVVLCDAVAGVSARHLEGVVIQLAGLLPVDPHQVGSGSGAGSLWALQKQNGCAGSG